MTHVWLTLVQECLSLWHLSLIGIIELKKTNKKNSQRTVFQCFALWFLTFCQNLMHLWVMERFLIKKKQNVIFKLINMIHTNGMSLFHFHRNGGLIPFLKEWNVHFCRPEMTSFNSCRNWTFWPGKYFAPLKISYVILI